LEQRITTSADIPGDFGVGMPEEDRDLRPMTAVGASENDMEGGVAYGAVGVIMCGYEFWNFQPTFGVYKY
jgi:hypothetical protein